MPKKKKEYIDEDMTLTIESTISLDEIKLKGVVWTAKLMIGEQLPRSYHKYKVVMVMNEEPFDDRIEDLEKALSESLFDNIKLERKRVKDQIAKVRKELRERKKECEEISFIAVVNELKYKDGGTQLTVVIPDDVIEPFNRQKGHMGWYIIQLDSIYS